jgi:hypothetical protein
MPRMTSIELMNWLARQKAKMPTILSGDEPCDRESKLRERILEYCDAQRPRWMVEWARSDKRSTLPPGCQDLAIWGPHPLCLLIELKTKTGKLDKDQMIWKNRMNLLGWEVHVVRSWEDFVNAVMPPQPTNT